MQGLDRLRWKLTRKIPRAVEQAAVQTMEAGATEIVRLMKSLAPVDEGELRDSIGWTWGAAPAGAMVLARSKVAGGKGRKQITIYAGNARTMVGSRNQFQLARLQEFGTQAMAANPFFFPAYRALRKRVRGRVTRGIRKAIRDGAK